MNRCFLLVGSNQGNKLENIIKAEKELQAISPLPIRVSKIYESEPWGFDSNEWFYNVAIELFTDDTASNLLKNILLIENKLGRIRDLAVKGYSSRIIDIDIIFFNNKVLVSDNLILPHPRVHLRRFALMPLCNLDPHIIHPTLNLEIGEILINLVDNSNVKELI